MSLKSVEIRSYEQLSSPWLYEEVLKYSGFAKRFAALLHTSFFTMALMLAPYNSAMRLGMGFNSYTQTLCVNDVVRKPGNIPATDGDYCIKLSTLDEP